MRIALVLLKILPEPAAVIFARRHPKLANDLPVRPGHKTHDLLLPGHQNGQRRRLDPARRSQPKSAKSRIGRRQRPRRIDAHQPVALAATKRRMSQGQHLRITAQLTKRLLNGRIGHRLHPQPLRRLPHPGRLDNITEN